MVEYNLPFTVNHVEPNNNVVTIIVKFTRVTRLRTNLSYKPCKLLLCTYEQKTAPITFGTKKGLTNNSIMSNFALEIEPTIAMGSE